MTDNKTKGGQDIIRSTPEERGWVIPEQDSEIREAVEAHVERFLGPSSSVWHEIVSDLVHIDVYKFEPTPERPFLTLVTSGMSDLPMTVPEGMEGAARAELLICLPPEWPLGQLGDSTTQGELADFNNYWPIQTLKFLARLPHQNRTWLGWGHSIPLGDSENPIANTDFIGCVIGPAITMPDEFVGLEIGDKVVWFYAIYPVFPEEMQFKIDTPNGGDALFELFEQAGVSELVDVNRKNVCL
ncbi:suppressor of fused domain protein [Deinococcus puniceus]|uniref:Suppressor of fused-like domain-containing protein n=1 Tax=Deinococcus puniceus TaxID=1182568 RepID=A0A172T8I5_9DEIO|nr:suppressor of fused domain protein [Deinococcus puniceus]ANE43262.1 hypothetical protein SU48_05205 [Deinococcus puniceus]